MIVMASGMSTEVPFKHNIVNGVAYPPFLDQQRMNEMKDYLFRPGDIFIDTFPKSGSTWTRQIVRLILNNGEDNGKTISESVPWLAAIGRIGPPVDDVTAFTDTMPSPRAFFGHAAYDMMPGGLPSASPAKYIYVARNPKDVMVSYYYHYVSGANGLFEFSGMLTWDVFFKLFMDDKIYFGSWFDHVLEWWKHKDDPNVLFLKYEDRHKDHLGAVRAIAEFTGFDLRPDVIEKIVKESAIDRMKVNPNTNFSDIPPGMFALNDINPFVRKGIVGDWKSLFTDDQLSIFEAVYQEKMKGSGLDFECES